MNPIAVPAEAYAGRPTLKLIQVGPPPGVSDDECGTVQALIGKHESGYPVFADYWRPNADELAALNAGGFIELLQFTPRMAMHAMNIWSAGLESTE